MVRCKRHKPFVLSHICEALPFILTKGAAASIPFILTEGAAASIPFILTKGAAASILFQNPLHPLRLDLPLAQVALG